RGWLMLLPVGREIGCRLKELLALRRCFAGPVFGTFSSLLNSTRSGSLRYQRWIVSVMERGNRPLLTKAALRLSSSMTAWIKKNPDNLRRYLQFSLTVWSQGRRF